MKILIKILFKHCVDIFLSIFFIYFSKVKLSEYKPNPQNFLHRVNLGKKGCLRTQEGSSSKILIKILFKHCIDIFLSIFFLSIVIF